jgi:hypothetical protein
VVSRHTRHRNTTHEEHAFRSRHVDQIARNWQMAPPAPRCLINLSSGCVHLFFGLSSSWPQNNHRFCIPRTSTVSYTCPSLLHTKEKFTGFRSHIYRPPFLMAARSRLHLTFLNPRSLCPDINASLLGAHTGQISAFLGCIPWHCFFKFVVACLVNVNICGKCTWPTMWCTK